MTVTLDLLAAAATAAPAEPPIWVTILPWFALFGVFWFLVLRPQMKRQKEQQTKIAGIKKGDQVLTAGGLVAKVTKVEDVYAELELAPSVRVRALKSTLADVVPPAGAAND
ncbi:preprotein translocase subunit YajC [Parablastomonas sp. CN1-191]|uniref:preprotein translocase subunit YajC n=1 Tax=Parablastomonas sp. CN1-191 TaxID=3400908 RepID=UPI003BF91215